MSNLVELLRAVFAAIRSVPGRIVDAFDPYADHLDYREERCEG